ncbi:HlyD family secretion protein [Terriglobus saanensis]|uniref:Secretion protein HlyD family protein n=1 Tax=Terriglobus saanensis (strain ATCC BAA-1853 / DSM 23119 / SP1PR4) TaxID=401053 RepID=E8V445_TERSS|nr:HlyD family secretion protein [Terriglobus saanensis]ADV82536.1 secretion protein HlyD family protein [Terriglobus saanensis SP1PR4]
MSKRAIIIPVLVLGTAAALLFTIKGHWTSWQGGSAEQRTDDAYVRADMTPMSTRISGTVKKVDVEDYEAVVPGQTLVELDDADYRATLAQTEAALAGSQAALANNQATKQIQDAKVQNAEAMVQQAAAAMAAAQAGVDSVQPDVTRSDLERTRQQALLDARATTHQQYELAIADATRFSGLLASRQADLQRAQAALSSSRTLVEAEKRQRVALNTQDALYQADIRAKQAGIVVAQVNLGYTHIAAPTGGVVGERHVQVGQLVAPGMQVIDLVQGGVWIQANFKETQLTNMRRGDDADIRVDTFPDAVLHGKVVEIAPASGSQFALLPPDNATGNFTKVVQRIPVKIKLDPGHTLPAGLRPGFSVIVTVHTSAHARSEVQKP